MESKFFKSFLFALCLVASSYIWRILRIELRVFMECLIWLSLSTVLLYRECQRRFAHVHFLLFFPFSQYTRANTCQRKNTCRLISATVASVNLQIEFDLVNAFMSACVFSRAFLFSRSAVPMVRWKMKCVRAIQVNTPAIYYFWEQQQRY